MVGDEADGGPPLLEVLVLQQIEQEADVRLHAPYPEFPQRPVQPLGSALERAARAGHLHQQAIEVGGNDGPGKGRAGIEPDAHPAGGAVGDEGAVVGLEVVGRVFGSYPALDGETVGLYIRLVLNEDGRVVQGITHGHEKLRPHQIDAGDLLRDGVLNLDSRINLNEVDRLVLVDQELHRSRAIVVDGPTQFQGVFVEFILRFLG